MNLFTLCSITQIKVADAYEALLRMVEKEQSQNQWKEL